MNRTGKRLFGMFVALIMIMTLIPTTAIAYESGRTLQYDDYIPVSDFGDAVTIGEESKDILKTEIEDGTEYIHAIGVGDATITVDGEEQTVTVEPAKINIVLVMGQSNATGEYNANYNETNQSSFDVASTACLPGTAYLWGNASSTEPGALAQSRGFRAALAAELYAKTNEKTVIVYNSPLTAKPGASINEWTDDNTTLNPDAATAARMVNNCYEYYEDSEYYEISSCGMYWLQGESNANMPATEYYEKFMALWAQMKEETDLSYCAFFRVRRSSPYPGKLDYMGPVIAQYQMTNDNADMYMATTLTEDWSYTADEYEKKVTIDTSAYDTIEQNSITTEYYKVFGGIHYYQLGYNIIGADAACNMAQTFGKNGTNQIVMGDSASGQTIALDGSTLNVADIKSNFMFHIAPGSESGTLDITITSGGTDITDRVIASEGAAAYLVNKTELAKYVDPTIEVTMRSPNGQEVETATYTVKTSATSNPAEVPDSKEDALYYHWDFTDESTYIQGLDADQNTVSGQAMTIKTAEDSEAGGLLTYTDATNATLSYSEGDGLVRSAESLTVGPTFAITNKDGTQGIATSQENGFMVEFTMKVPSSRTYAIVLGQGSTNANSGHPFVYKNSNSFTWGGASPKATVNGVCSQADQLTTYRVTFDGDATYHLTVVRGGETIHDADFALDQTATEGRHTWNYLFPSFSTNGSETSYLFTGSITDLKFWTSYYFHVEAAGTDGQYSVTGLAETITAEGECTFTATASEGYRITSVDTSSGTITDNGNGTYTLSGVREPATVTVHTASNLPESKEDALYYHWDFTDASTYVQGLDTDQNTVSGQAMAIKTAEDSEAGGLLTYTDETNATLSYSEIDGLVRSAEGLKLGPTFAITNKDGTQGIATSQENGFMVEFTMEVPSSRTYAIVLGKGSPSANGGHPFVYKNGNSFTWGGASPRAEVKEVCKEADELTTYRVTFDGDETYHLTVIRDGETIHDADFALDQTATEGRHTWNYLFPSFSTDGSETSYLFTGSITDLKFWTSYAFPIIVEGTDGQYTVKDMPATASPDQEVRFNISANDGYRVTSVEASSGTLVDIGNGTYTLSGVRKPVSITVNSEEDGHTWDSGRTEKEATCDETGLIFYKCLDAGCEATKTEVVAALGHDLSWEVTKEPTYNAAGIRTATCSRCDYQETEAIPMLGAIYYHWDFTKAADYLHGLSDDEAMQIKTAEDSQGELVLVNSDASNTGLSHDEDAGLIRDEKTKEAFAITNSDGEATLIHTSLENGFVIEFTGVVTGSSQNIILGRESLGINGGHPFIFKTGSDFCIYSTTGGHGYVRGLFNDVSGVATYRFAYDGDTSWTLTVTQGETSATYDINFEDNKTPLDTALYWGYLFPDFLSNDGNLSYNFSGSISDLKFWTSYYFTSDITGSSNNTYTLDGLTAGGTVTAEENEFTVEAADGYHVVSVTASNGTITKNADGSYTLSDVTADTTIAIQTAVHTFGSTWEHDAEYHWHTCTGEDCGAVEGKAAHTWDAGEVTTEAGVGITGEKTYTCTACGATKTEEIPALLPTSGGSGGGFTSTTYPVTVDSGRHGDVTTSTKNAKQGATVTITVKPDDGYELDDLTVTDKNGKTIKVTEGKNGKYTFTMPASKVTVEATFAQIEEAPEHSFTDVPGGHWAESEITWAYESGYMNGNTATTFNPNGTVTRQQLWMILARLSGQRPANFEEAKAWAVDNGVSDGTNPGSAVSRQQLVTILYRYAAMMGYKTGSTADLTVFPDYASVAAYATDAMRWSVANSIVGGTAQGTLNPTGTATRAQFAVILFRFCGNIAK